MGKSLVSCFFGSLCSLWRQSRGGKHLHCIVGNICKKGEFQDRSKRVTELWAIFSTNSVLCLLRYFFLFVVLCGRLSWLFSSVKHSLACRNVYSGGIQYWVLTLGGCVRRDGLPARCSRLHARTCAPSLLLQLAISSASSNLTRDFIRIWKRDPRLTLWDRATLLDNWMSWWVYLTLYHRSWW